MVIRVGKEQNDKESEGKPQIESGKKKSQSPIKKSEHGPMDTIKTQNGLEDPDNVFFGDIESDLYVVEPGDARPRRIDRVEPPEKPREGALYLGEARKYLRRKGNDGA